MALTHDQQELTKLYLASFLRAPATSGFDYWQGQILSGASINDVGQTIFSLDIVKAIYPDTLTNAEFITSIYHNVFGKAPEAAGRDYWQAKMDAGEARGTLVLDMINTGLATPDGTDGKAYIVNRVAAAEQAVQQQAAQGTELTAARLTEIMAGVTADAATVTAAQTMVNHDTGADVNNPPELTKLYLASFLRAPALGGYDYWLGQLNAGESVSSLGDTIFGLDIVKAIYPATLSNTEFVTSIYHNVFGKAPEAAGLTYWQAKMDAGEARGALVLDMINTGLATPDGTDGKAYIVNRVAAAQHAVDQQVAQGTELTVASLTEIMAGVTADATTVTAAQTMVDQGTGAHLAGKLTDGYLRDATVFADANGNGVWDAGEATATTNANGDFNLTGAHGKIIATGGTDIATNLPFHGVLTAPAGSTMVTPLTTLVQSIVDSGATVEQAQTHVLAALGLPATVNLQTFDAMAVALGTGSAADKADAAHVQAALAQVANVLDLGTAAIQGASSTTTAADAMAQMASALANNLSAATATVDLTQTATLQSVMTEAAANSTDTGAATAVTASLNDIASVMSSANTSVNTAMTDNPTDLTAAMTQVAQVQVVVQGSMSDSMTTGMAAGSITSTVTDFTGTALDTAVTAAVPGDLTGAADTTGPSLVAVTPITAEATSAAGAAVAFGTTASDLVDGTETVTYQEGSNAVVSGDTFALGTHTITASATDAAHNTSSETFTITVADHTAPSLVAVTPITAEATSAAGAAVAFGTTASDLVDGTDTVTYQEGSNAVVSGATFALGAHTITASATDAAHNTSSETFTITVADTTGPVLVAVTPITAEATRAAGAAVAFGTTASDIVDGTETVTYKEGTNAVVSGATFALGTHTITASATDAAHNTSSETFTITVADTVAPSAPTVALHTDSGSSGTDKITNVSTLNVSGTESGAVLSYSTNSTNGTNGTWTSSFAAADGANTVYVRQTDVAGNVSSGTALTFTYDHTAAAPTVALTTDSGSSGTDKISNVGTLAVSGTESGAVLSYSTNSTNGTNGTWTSSFTAADGANTVYVRQTDVAGNVSTGTALTFTYDHTAAAPTVALTHDTGATGDNTDLITSNGALTVSGTETGAVVEYSATGTSGWSATAPTAAVGANTVYVRQTDVAGNVSAASTALTFTLDTSADKGAAATLVVGDTLVNNAEKTAVSFTVAGLDTDAKGVVTFTDSASHHVTANVAADSSATVDLSTLTDGAITTSLAITDAANNTATVTGTAITLDTVALAPSFALHDTGTGAATTDHITSDHAVTVTLATDMASWQYTLDGNAGSPTWNTGTGTSFNMADDTTYASGDIQVRQSDAAGNVSTPASNTGTWQVFHAAVTDFGTVTPAQADTSIVIADPDATGSTAAGIHTLTLVAPAATSIVVTGNNGLTLTNTGNVAVTSFDASGVVANDGTDTAAHLAVNFTNANTTNAAVSITGGAGDDFLSGGANSSSYANSVVTINGGAGNDWIFGGAGSYILSGGNGADYLTEWIGNYASTNGNLIFGGSVTTSDANGIYAESQDVIVPGINAQFASLFGPNYSVKYHSIFTGANIYEGWDGNQTLVATNQKDIFHYQTGNGGAELGHDEIQNFKVGTDFVMVVNGSDAHGDNVFFGSQAAADAWNLALNNHLNDTYGYDWDAMAHGWSYVPESATAGTLTYAPVDSDPANGGTAPGFANFSIHFDGIQGTVTNADSFFYSATPTTISSGSFTEGGSSTIHATFDGNMAVTDTAGLTVQINGADANIATGISATTNAINITSTTTLASTDFVKISYDGGTGNITDVAGNALASLTYYIGGSGSNTISALADGAGVRIDANGGNDILRGSNYSDIINGGTGNDDINGKLASITGPNILIGGDGADYIQGQSYYSIVWNATDLAAGLYNDVIFTGSQTTGVAATSGTWTGTLYAEGTDQITTSGMSAAFVNYFAGQLTTTFAPIFNAANIVDGAFGADTIVASTAKDVFLFQTHTTGANDGISISGKTIEHFQIGTDVIAALNYNGGGDHVFVGSQAAADTFNALHNGDAVLADSQWTWALDAGKTDAGTLTYANTTIIEGGTAAFANMTIHLVGVQGTIVDVNSFFDTVTS